MFSVTLVYSSFKLFLELEPQLRDVLYKFHESQYAACLKLLDEMKVRRVMLMIWHQIVEISHRNICSKDCDEKLEFSESKCNQKKKILIN